MIEGVETLMMQHHDMTDSNLAFIMFYDTIYQYL